MFPVVIDLSQQAQADSMDFPMAYSPPQGSQVTAYPSYEKSLRQDGGWPHLGQLRWIAEGMTSRRSRSLVINPTDRREHPTAQGLQGPVYLPSYGR